MNLERLLRDHTLLADGSTGTALEALAPDWCGPGQLLPLERPDLVLKLHHSYIEAGSDLIESASFSSSARSLVRAGVMVDARELNRVAGSLARLACDHAYGRDGRRRWAAGSIGPGEEAPSLGSGSWAELRDSYLPQMLGLLDGGVDCFVIETCQDPLQIKAALAAAREAGHRAGRIVPCVVSATVESNGRMLTGTSMEALVAIVAPYKPAALGVNCSGGPDELSLALGLLASVSPFPLSLMPNAGLPVMVDGRTAYPLGPDAFARGTSALARRYGVALVGGCCGTGPEHIRVLDRLMRERPKPSERAQARASLASLYDARPLGPGLFRIGERGNVSGSAVFRKLMAEDNREAMASFMVKQEAEGAEALDLHVMRPGRDEAADLVGMARALRGRARSALCLDSTDPEALEAALREYPGRALINSASLDDEDKARRVVALAREYGAALVCLCVGAAGPAKTLNEKLDLAHTLYKLAVDGGLGPDDIFVDTVTFPLAAASKGLRGAARASLEALALVKEKLPGVRTILGVGNSSFGLPKAIRPAVTAVFLDEALRHGLDAAIMDAGRLPDLSALDPALVDAARRLINAGPTDDSDDAMSAILSFGGVGERTGDESEPGQAPLPPEEALAAAVIDGDPSRAYESGKEVLAIQADTGFYSRVVAGALKQVGDGFADGSIPLPLVLRSAEAAERALSLLAQSQERADTTGGVVILATVKGDLHDIGKNLAGLILAGAGYRVVDLGVDAGVADILQAARQEAAMAIGLSGLLMRSLSEMEAVAGALADVGCSALLLLGGAAVDKSYVDKRIEPLYPGRVMACADAFEAIRVLDRVDKSQRKNQTSSIPPRAVPKHGGRRQLDGQRSSTPVVPQKPRLPWVDVGACGVGDVEMLAWDELGEALNARSLMDTRWAYGRSRRDEARALLDGHLADLKKEGALKAYVVRALLACERDGETLLVEAPGAWDSRKAFPFPREPSHAFWFLSGLPDGVEGRLPVLAATVGRLPLELALAERERGRHGSYHRVHCLGAALAEAAMEAAHRRFARELGERRGKDTAKWRRVSFGYPRCPGLERQADLLDALDTGRIGLSLSASCQLVPELSVTAVMEPYAVGEREPV